MNVIAVIAVKQKNIAVINDYDMSKGGGKRGAARLQRVVREFAVARRANRTASLQRRLLDEVAKDEVKRNGGNDEHHDGVDDEQHAVLNDCASRLNAECTIKPQTVIAALSLLSIFSKKIVEFRTYLTVIPML